MYVLHIIDSQTLELIIVLCEHEKPTNCGTKAADVLAKCFSQQTLMQIH